MHITKQQLLTSVIIVVIGIVAVQYYTNAVVARELEATRLALTAQIAEQEVVLTNVADLTRSGEADEVTKRIVVDCSTSERQRFEILLDQLSTTISQTELRELDGLFFKCGRFFADRKAVMATRLIREVAVYSDSIALRNNIVGIDGTLAERVVLWQQLADAELSLATDFNQLVELQRDIIIALLANKERNDPEILETLRRVTETRNNMTMRTTQIENARTQLRAL